MHAAQEAAPGRAVEVVVVGSINVDLTVTVTRRPRPGETVIGGGGAATPGGKGANQAVAAAGHGARVRMIGAVGDDQHADLATTALEQAGVDISAVRRVPGPTGLAVVTVDAGAENSIVVVPGANAAVTADRVLEHRTAVSGAAVVVVQGEIPRAGTECAARLCRGRLVLNPSPVGPLDPDVLRAADPLVVNVHEAARVVALLAGRHAEGDDDGDGDAQDLRESIRTLLAKGVTSVVLTRGADGALVGAGAGPVHEVPAPRVRTVDTTGAGDALSGVLAAELAGGTDLLAASRIAVAAAARTVTVLGARA